MQESKIDSLNNYLKEQKDKQRQITNFKISLVNKKISNLNKKKEKEILKIKNCLHKDQARVDSMVEAKERFYKNKIEKIDQAYNKSLVEFVNKKNKRFSELKLKITKDIENINLIFRNYKKHLNKIQEVNVNEDNKKSQHIEKKCNGQIEKIANKIKKLSQKFATNKIKKSFFEKQIKKKEDKIRSLEKAKLQKLNNQTNKDIMVLNFKLNLWLQKTQESQIKKTKLFSSFLGRNKILLLALSLSLIPTLNHSSFLTYSNIFENVLSTNAGWGVLALGMTFVILTGGIDLSIGSMLALVGYGSITLIVQGYDIWIAALAGIGFAILLSGIQGFFIGVTKLPPFIVTLVGMLAFRGLLRVLIEGETITSSNPNLFDFAIGNFLWIPYHFWVFLIVLALLSFVLKFTKIGRYTYAVGSNEEAAKLSGIRTNWIIIFAYVIMGLTVAIAAMLHISNIQSISPSTASGKELDAIAAVVLGGTTLAGGKGSVLKTFVGWITISILNNALTFMAVQSEWQIVIKGLVILVTVLFDKELKITQKILNLKELVKNQFVKIK